MGNRLHVGVEYNPRRRTDPKGDLVREKKGVTQLRNLPLLRPPMDEDPGNFPLTALTPYH